MPSREALLHVLAFNFKVQFKLSITVQLKFSEIKSSLSVYFN